ncbi:MAG: ATP-binding protein [candidate division KSB1 bacterium]|nr:ATP-binding protein [candidate division KSB1 bacterium]
MTRGVPTAGESRVQPPQSPPRVTAEEAALRLIHRNLGSVLLLLAVFHLVLSIDYAFILPPSAASVLSRTGLGLAALLVVLALVSQRPCLSPRGSEVLFFVSVVLTLANVVLPIRLHPEPKHTFQVALVVAGLGLLGVRPRVLVASCILAAVAWTILASPHLSLEWIPYGGALLLAVLFAAVAQPYRLRSIQQAENLRLENEWRREQLLRALAALRNSEERFRRLSEAAFEAIAIHHQGEILDANQAFALTFGYSSERIRGSSIRRYIVCSDTQVLETLFRGTARTVEAMGIHSDGTLFPIEIRVKALPYAGLQARVVAIRDVSDRRRTEAILRRAKEEAEKASELKSRWLASISHELRTPLNSIIGFSEMLADQYFGPLNEKQQRYVSNILTSGRQLLQMINDLLDLSKIEAGRMQLEITEFDPRQVIQSTIEAVSPLAFQKQIHLEAELSRCPKTIQADAGKFRQILFNLLSNAIKYTGEGGTVRVVAEAEQRSATAYHQGTLLKVSVQDTGIGLRPEHLRRIFEEFEQIPNPYQSVHKGTGLGLPLAQKLVRLHGGTLWAESEGEGKGSTFTFVIPVRREDAQALHHPATPVTVEPRAQRVRVVRDFPLVLVIDDDAESTELLQDAMTAAGYQVLAAHDPASGESLALRENPDVIVLDVLFDRQEKGWDLLSRLKALPETAPIPVVVVSVLDNHALSRQLGAVAHLDKPVDIRQLLRTLSQLTASRTGLGQRVLVAHGDPEFSELLAETLARAGFSVVKVHDGMQALQLATKEAPDAMVISLSLPKVAGQNVVRYLKRYPQTKDIVFFVLADRELEAAEQQELSRLAHIIRDLSPGTADGNAATALATHVARLLHNGSRAEAMTASSK